MTDLERLELALRQVRAQRHWETSTIPEFINDLIENLTEKNVNTYNDLMLERQK